jgi:hypothetical protein
MKSGSPKPLRVCEIPDPRANYGYLVPGGRWLLLCNGTREDTGKLLCYDLESPSSCASPSVLLDGIPMAADKMYSELFFSMGTTSPALVVNIVVFTCFGRSKLVRRSYIAYLFLLPSEHYMAMNEYIEDCNITTYRAKLTGTWPDDYLEIVMLKTFKSYASRPPESIFVKDNLLLRNHKHQFHYVTDVFDWTKSDETHNCRSTFLPERVWTLMTEEVRSPPNFENFSLTTANGSQMHDSFYQTIV